VEGTGETVALAPAERSVSWDAARKRPRKLSGEERSARSRLESQWREGPDRVEVVGCLVESTDKEGYLLEVRSFKWIRSAGKSGRE